MIAQLFRRSAETRDDAVEAALHLAERANLRVAGRVRVIGVTVVLAWIWLENSPPMALYLSPLIGLFIVSGVVQIGLARWPGYRTWQIAAITAGEVLLLCFLVLSPNPYADFELPVTMALRWGNFGYTYMLLIGIGFLFSPRLALFTGIWTALAWAGGVAIIAAQDGSFTQLDLAEPWRTADQFLAVFLDPSYVDLNKEGRNIVGVLIIAGSLAVLLQRNRALVHAQAIAAQQRANLARYFSPKVVDDLAAGAATLQRTREQPVAILFADIVGFTRLAETLSGPEIIAVLRGFQQRMEQAVFAHDGTLEKFVGDGVMASFGNPIGTGRDAGNALRAGIAMQAAIAAWNRERGGPDAPPLRIGVGIAFGRVTIGNVGSERQMEFTVIGDVVNVASRLESLCRDLDVDLVVSGDAIAQARGEGADAGLLGGFSDAPPQAVRGRAEPVPVLTWRA